ncbi:hypothetical protein P8V03_04560 [Clostridium sp. A1-XYC3]|uniref:Uncharacterized protein n=1 Tax=Clostridium tanneri TaxID=3037988 RepID=A0ABU4JR45_9CLOT|nr:hypothetical protein [Clostridium sp. A1-XYC3]MDW8800423.1 hypothetical protein [Clostridium sp. A1-XYC3]
MGNFEKMTSRELEKKLLELKEYLEDVEEERMHVLGQTGIHVPGAAVRKYEAEIEEIKNNIRQVEHLLGKK